MDNWNLIVAIGFIAVLGLVFLAGLPFVIEHWLWVRRRRKGLKALAKRLGFEYSERDSVGLPGLYTSTVLFENKSYQKASWSISGPLSYGRVVCFECGERVSNAAGNVVACAFHGPFAFRKLHVKPEVPGDPWFRDIDLDLSQFNDRFYVQASDKKFAYEILTQQVMQFLLEHPRLRMELAHDYLLVYKLRGLLESLGERGPEADEIENLIIEVKQLAELLPGYLRCAGIA